MNVTSEKQLKLSVTITSKDAQEWANFFHNVKLMWHEQNPSAERNGEDFPYPEAVVDFKDYIDDWD